MFREVDEGPASKENKEDEEDEDEEEEKPEGGVSSESTAEILIAKPLHHPDDIVTMHHSTEQHKSFCDCLSCSCIEIIQSTHALPQQDLQCSCRSIDNCLLPQSLVP
ncbi:unnamed protein product [Pleuronectes platessa]|uniref:Uncharacterized protein n=1 Tax=Pleuronectes platessa TaxID=8262 RepID=A0A9N7VYI4_PLEPL|nr:unnamed protein product [Pleuronectes platessa]